MLDGVFMSVHNFDWLVLYEIMTREVRNVKKENKTKKKETVLGCKQKSDKNLTTVVGPQWDLDSFKAQRYTFQYNISTIKVYLMI